MSKCTAPVEGHQDAATKAKCPACGSAAAGLVGSTVMSPPPSQATESEGARLARIGRIAEERGFAIGPAQDALRAARLTIVVAQAEGIVATARAACPSLESVVWYPNDEDYSDGKSCFSCGCSDEVLDSEDFSDAHDMDEEFFYDTFGQVSYPDMVAISGSDAVAKTDANLLHGSELPSDPRFDGRERVESQVFLDHAEGLGIARSNRSAQDAIRREGIRWWGLTPESPDVLLALRINQNL